MDERYYIRPSPSFDGSVPLAGGPARFSRVELITREARRVCEFGDCELDAASREALSGARGAVAGVALDRPRVMGVLNVTPDSFSDGGVHLDASRAVESGLAMVEAGADFLDVGGESTRPGAEPMPLETELARVLPVIEGLKRAGCAAPISIDTRKAAVARAAFDAGARIFNDVSALSHDPDSPATAAALCPAGGDGWVCLMHSQGDPQVMQKDPRYEDVLLDVYDALAERARAAFAAGVGADRILIDPGIGFGKTLEHNLTLLRGLSVFHGLGAPLLLGVSRKRFIGVLTGVEIAAERMPGSVAAALWGVAQGAQIVRVHDVVETAQALAMWRALQNEMESE